MVEVGFQWITIPIKLKQTWTRRIDACVCARDLSAVYRIRWTCARIYLWINLGRTAKGHEFPFSLSHSLIHSHTDTLLIVDRLRTRSVKISHDLRTRSVSQETGRQKLEVWWSLELGLRLFFNLRPWKHAYLDLRSKFGTSHSTGRESRWAIEIGFKYPDTINLTFLKIE